MGAIRLPSGAGVFSFYFDPRSPDHHITITQYPLANEPLATGITAGPDGALWLPRYSETTSVESPLQVRSLSTPYRRLTAHELVTQPDVSNIGSPQLIGCSQDKAWRQVRMDLARGWNRWSPRTSASAHTAGCLR